MFPNLSFRPFITHPPVPSKSLIKAPPSERNDIDSSEKEIAQLFQNAIAACNGKNGTELPAGTTVSLADKMTGIMVNNRVPARDVSELLSKGHLKVGTFIDNESLIDVFAQAMKKALDRYDALFPNGSVIYFRSTLPCLISAAFDRESIDRKGTVATIRNETYLVRLKAKRAEVYAIDTGTIKPLAKGKFLTALVAFDRIKFSNVVLKKPNILDSEHMNKILYEKKAIKEIHAGRPENQHASSGIKSIPYAVLGTKTRPITDPVFHVEGNEGFYLVEEHYEMQLYDQIVKWNDLHLRDKQASISERLKACRMLLQDVAAIHASGYAHGDIKLTNILVKVMNDELVAHLSDFGDATNKAKIMADPSLFRLKPVGVYTRYYVLPSDIIKEQGTACIEDMDKASDKVMLCKQRRDMFALGIVIAIILSGGNPFSKMDEIGFYEYPDLNQPLFEGFMKEIVPEEKYEPLRNLIWKMLDQCPKERLTASQALEAFDQIVC